MLLSSNGNRRDTSALALRVPSILYFVFIFLIENVILSFIGGPILRYFLGF